MIGDRLNKKIKVIFQDIFLIEENKNNNREPEKTNNKIVLKTKRVEDHKSNRINESLNITPRMTKLESTNESSKMKFRNSTGINPAKTSKENKNKPFTDEEWIQIINADCGLKHVNHERLIISLKMGINDKLRGKIWFTLSKCLDIVVNHSENLFYNLVATNDPQLEDLIMKDIERTIIYTYNSESHELSKVDISSKHKKLFNVLKAYAIYDAEVSYCQGTNYIVAMLLKNNNSERACFWSFVQIMNDKKWRDLFIDKTPKLLRMLDLLKNSVENKLPKLYEYLENINFIEYFSAVFSQYFITLFSYNCPVEYANRVIDLFWLYEEKVIFDCLLHILNLKEKTLMTMSMDELFPYFRDKIVIDAIESFGLEKSLPYQL